jgi:NAD(P)-dependent dehydrogenase (short-subunit alcohol dehydrogenase family)
MNLKKNMMRLLDINRSIFAPRRMLRISLIPFFKKGLCMGLVNNAAGNFISPTKDLSARGFDAIANIVFHGTFYVTQCSGKEMA